ncbi:unnamed protein product [Arabis nemorensis]|uniref:Uncharacterized protein n=1 Tax=Arabis nemorensis TaxID=586526 RepID=A0A565AVB7_9BRAS|nr:unnamed protein product [Arabis nemorensis]
MVKAKFKRVNYTDLPKRVLLRVRGLMQPLNKPDLLLPLKGTKKAIETSLTAKKAGKRVADPPVETAKKVSEEVGKKRPTESAIEGSKKKQRIVESTQKTAAEEVAAMGSEGNPSTYDLSFNFKSKISYCDYSAGLRRAMLHDPV